MAGEPTADGRTSRPQRRDAAANRARILDAAVVTVKREGFRVPMATIAQDAGVGIGTLYRHFPSREQLMVGLTERSFELLLANVRSAAAPEGSVREAFGRWFEQTIADRDEFVLPWHGGPSVQSDRTVELQSEIWRLIDAMLHRGRDDGSIRDDLRAADLVLFAAMLAQPLPNADHWDHTARRQAQVYLAGMGDLHGGRLPRRPSAGRRSG